MRSNTKRTLTLRQLLLRTLLLSERNIRTSRIEDKTDIVMSSITTIFLTAVWVIIFWAQVWIIPTLQYVLFNCIAQNIIKKETIKIAMQTFASQYSVIDFYCMASENTFACLLSKILITLAVIFFTILFVLFIIVLYNVVDLILLYDAKYGKSKNAKIRKNKYYETLKAKKLTGQKCSRLLREIDQSCYSGDEILNNLKRISQKSREYMAKHKAYDDLEEEEL